MNPPHDFLLQAEDLVARLDEEIDALRSALARRDGIARRDATARLFRTAHTLKGSAATFGEDLVAQIADDIEDALQALGGSTGAIIDDGIAFDAAGFVAALRDAADVIGVRLRVRTDAPDMRVRAQLARAAEATGRDLRLRTANLRAAESFDARAENIDAIVRALPRPWRDAPPAAGELARLRDAARDGIRLFSLTIGFEDDTFDDDFRLCDELLRGHGEIILTRPLPRAAEAAARARFAVLYAAALDSDAVSRLIRGFEIEIETLPVAAHADAAAESLVSRAEESRAITSPPEPSSSVELRVDAGLVRVPLDALDDLILRIGELEEDVRSALAQTPDGFAREDAAKPDHIRERFAAVQERILGLRMVTLAGRLNEAVRAGRVAARAADKSIVWEVRGGDVRIDRALAERLSAPLSHLVRNAVDHGIETAAERSAAGKSARGTIRIEAHAGGGRVRVLVTDDGRGIDPERVRRAGVRRGVIPLGRDLAAGEHLRLIFLHGLTTAGLDDDGDTADDTSAIDPDARGGSSGRGVGLDAVDRSLTEAGGRLRVDSRAGSGTTFELRLPITHAVVDAWIVRAGSHRYCLAAEHVGEVIRPDADAAQVAAGVRLAELVRGDLRESSAQVALMRIDGVAQPLSVDAIEARRELIVRGLGAHAAQWGGVVGAAVLADGSAALLLDIAELIESRRP